MSGQKTYWHLAQLGRAPQDYDIATSRLLYYPARGFEVRTPVTDWYGRHQQGSSLRAADWEAFRDPRETTYTRYTETQKAKEIFVDGLFRSVDAATYDRQLSADWVRVLDRVIGPLRYPVHGCQMVAAYLGSIAPAGRIVITCLCQAADEIRRIQRLAQRMRQLQETYPAFGVHSRSIWEEDPHWQPLRRLVERLLVTYDWGEAFVALNLVVKPVFDALFTVQLAHLAERQQDTLFAKMLFSLEEDEHWHQEWSLALARTAIEQVPENGVFLRQCIARWQPAVAAIAEPLAGVCEPSTDGQAELIQAILRDWAERWRGVGLAVESDP